MSETKVDETKPSETKPKKMVSRSVAIALGIICIVLIAGLVGAFAYYVTSMNDKDNTISMLNGENAGLSAGNTNLQNQVNDLTNTLNLNKTWKWSTSFNEPIMPSSYFETRAGDNTLFSVDYAGYISVDIYKATNPVYVEVVYSSHGANYDNTVNVGTDGTAVFPILPTSSVIIRVGTHSTSLTTIDTVTTTYYY